ncbi:MAG: hypothetical protein HWE27_04495 [Gammaproteobacteria bacterium]|nr:hypothetical protein [Gammaproteobacteria bacterium]
MKEVRMILAILAFLFGVFLILDLIINGFDFLVLVASLLSLICTHYIKPKDLKGQYDYLDPVVEILDVVLDIPFKIISIFFRGIGRSGKDDVVDLDL